MQKTARQQLARSRFSIAKKKSIPLADNCTESSWAPARRILIPSQPSFHLIYIDLKNTYVSVLIPLFCPLPSETATATGKKRSVLRYSQIQMDGPLSDD